MKAIKPLKEWVKYDAYLCLCFSSQPIKKFLDLLFQLKNQQPCGISSLHAQHCVWCSYVSEFTTVFEISTNRHSSLVIRMNNHKKRLQNVASLHEVERLARKGELLKYNWRHLTDFMHQSIGVIWDNGRYSQLSCICFFSLGKHLSHERFRLQYIQRWIGCDTKHVLSLVSWASVHHSSSLQQREEWQETRLLHQPCWKPSDSLSPEVLLASIWTGCGRRI